MRKALEERFREKYRTAEGEACWEWTGAINTHGYGTFRVGVTNVGAHRVAWELTNGAIPDGLQVCHRCDNRRCVRPEHMFLGTIADNMADRNAKGRQWHPKGTLHGAAKLTDDAVRTIRRLYAAGGTSQKKLGEQFGVSTMLVNGIVRGKRWAHVAEVRP